jgi:CheY-like chemotaxis protein
MAPYLVVVEDDHLQEGPLEEQLQDAFPTARIDTVSTEKEFRERLTDFRNEPPDVVVLDVMLRWAFPSPDASPPPADVVEGGYYRAGMRCEELMRKDSKLCDVPVIFYTILERSDLERDDSISDNTRYVRKSSDLEVLTRVVRKASRTTAK